MQIIPAEGRLASSCGRLSRPSAARGRPSLIKCGKPPTVFQSIMTAVFRRPRARDRTEKSGEALSTRRKKKFFRLAGVCLAVPALIWLVLIGRERHDAAGELLDREQRLLADSLASLLGELLPPSGHEGHIPPAFPEDTAGPYSAPAGTEAGSRTGGSVILILNGDDSVLMAAGDSPRPDEAVFLPSLREMRESGEGPFRYEWKGESWRGRYAALAGTNRLILTARPESAARLPFMPAAAVGTVFLIALPGAVFLAWARASRERDAKASPPGADMSGTARNGIPEGASSSAPGADDGPAILTEAFQSEFLARLNHEMRTPLNAVMGMSYLFSQTAMTEQQRGYIDKLQQGVQTLLDMINQLLDFSSLTRDALELEEHTFRLSSLMEGLCSANAPKAEKRNLEFVIRVDPLIPETLEGAPARIAQILHALADNAVRFTETGEVVVEARLETSLAEHQNDALIRFEVRDTGSGMSPETLARSLQPFGQGDGSNTRAHGGLGLGLPLAQRLCRFMGGELNVESVPGRGTTAFFVLRLKRSDSISAPLRPQCGSGTVRALVADDNASSLAVLREMLEFLGFGVTTASSGDEALEAMRRFAAAGEAPDLFVADWIMPGMDGLECICRAADMTPAPTMPPALLLAGPSGRPDGEALARAGIAACLAKPVLLPALHGALAPLLLRKGQRDASAPLRILLVEDNEINQEIALALLDDQGMDIDVAHNGLEAVDKVRDGGPGKYALVFMDVQMPVMDGLEAASRIRGMGYGLSALPIIAMTAQGQEEDKRQCFAAGMNDHMLKPLEPERLNAVLRHWLGVGANASAHDGQHGISFDRRGSDLISSVMQAIDSGRRTSGTLIPATGLDNVGGNRSLYLKLLRRFIESYPETDKDINTALRRGDTELAIRLAHTVKSISASLGLADFSSISAEVEKELKAGALDDTMGAAFTACLHESLRAVEEYLTGPSAGEAASPPAGPEADTRLPVPAAHVRTLVREILDNLEMDWGVIMNDMEELERLLGGTCRHRHMDELSSAVEDFDVPRTRAAARHLLDDLEPPAECRGERQNPAQEKNGAT